MQQILVLMPALCHVLFCVLGIYQGTKQRSWSVELTHSRAGREARRDKAVSIVDCTVHPRAVV